MASIDLREIIRELIREELALALNLGAPSPARGRPATKRKATPSATKGNLPVIDASRIREGAEVRIITKGRGGVKPGTVTKVNAKAETAIIEFKRKDGTNQTDTRPFSSIYEP